MPLLEYRCSECQQLFERLVPRTDGADRGECPTCGQLTGQRVLSLVAQPRASSAGASPAAAGGCCGGSCCGGS